MTENNKINTKDIIKLIWIGIKVAVVLFAIFQGTNVSILYQGF